MKANWLILTMERSHGVWPVYDAVERAGYTVKACAELPRERDSIFPEASCVVVNGPADRIAELKALRGWTPIGWGDASSFACQTYYTAWGDFILQRKYRFLSLDDLVLRQHEIHHELAIDGAVFVRPDSHNKIFDATLLQADKLDAWLAALRAVGVPGDTLCVVSRPEIVGDEFRLVICNRKVIAGSSYRIGGKFNKTVAPTQRVIEFAEAVAAQPYAQLPALYVLDVCESSERPAIVEVGSINSSGFYGCDMDVVVRAISEQAEADWRRLPSQANSGATK